MGEMPSCTLKVLLLPSICLLAFLSMLAAGQLLVSKHAQRAKLHDEFAEVLYLPNGEALDRLSFGYRNALSQLLWFTTINYFGKHYQSDQSYRWLGHMCALVTRLNPKAWHAYNFCAHMLAWEAKDPAAANEILSAAVQADPNNWYYFYMRGFNSTFFLKNDEAARDDFIAASKLPNANPIAAHLAAKKVAKIDTPETAAEFLVDALSRTTDPVARKVFIGRLEKLFKANPELRSQFIAKGGAQ